MQILWAALKDFAFGWQHYVILAILSFLIVTIAILFSD